MLLPSDRLCQDVQDFFFLLFDTDEHNIFSVKYYLCNNWLSFIFLSCPFTLFFSERCLKSEKKMSIRPGQIVVQSTPRGSMGVGGTTMISSTRRSNVMGGGFGGGTGMLLPTGEASNLSKQAVMTVKGVRGKEKKELCDLNGRLASYLEKVKFLEATNKALSEECAKLRKLKGVTGDRVKELYEGELQECREALQETQKEISPLQAKNLALEDEVDKYMEE